MLTMEIDLDHLGAAWHRDGRGLRGPAGSVSPLGHPITEARVTAGRDNCRLEVAERYGGTDSLLVQADATGVRITAGSGGVCPLYLVIDGRVLRGSWNPADLLRSVAPARLVDTAVTRLLTRRQRYSATTIFDGLYKLTERATVEVKRVGLAVTYPEPAEHLIRPRTLRAGADPVGAFDRLLTERLAPLAEADGLVWATEISGGLDSTTVATAMAQVRGVPDLRSVGLHVEGLVGVEQAARRRAIVHKLGLTDFAVSASASLPFEAYGARSVERLHYADGDVYVEAFDQLRGRLKDAGVQAVLTGFGGDELMALRGSEREGGRAPAPPELPSWLGERALGALPDLDKDIAPVSPVPVSALMVFAARNPAYIAHGLWPVAPLADPGLLRLCESLPVSWRRNKTLLRRYLQRAGFCRRVTDPNTIESFQFVMEEAMRHSGTAMIEQMLDDSILVDHGYIERRSLELVHAGVVAGRPAPRLTYDMLAVERSLQSVRNARQRDGVTR